MAAIITISQPTGAGAGLPGFARKGLWVGQEVQLIDAGAANNVSWVWTIDDASAGCTVVITDAFSPIARITPNRTGTWKVTLTVNGGGPGNVQTFVFRVQRSSTGVLLNYGLVAPAFNELPAHANYNGNTRGYAEIWDEVVDGIVSTIADLETQIVASGVLPTREINTSNGLAGGGDLSTNRTISLVLDGSSLQVSETGIRVGTITDAMHGALTGEGLHQAATSGTAGFATALQIQMLEAHEVSILDFGPRIGALETGLATVSGGISNHETRIENLESGGGGGGGSSALNLTVTMDLTVPGEVWVDLTPGVIVPVNTSAYYDGVFVLRRRDTQDDETGTPYTAVRTYSGVLRIDVTRGSTTEVLVELVPTNDGETVVELGGPEQVFGDGVFPIDHAFEIRAVATSGGFKLQLQCSATNGLAGDNPFGLVYVSPETNEFAETVPVDAKLGVSLELRSSVVSAGELPVYGTIVVVD